MKNLLIFFLSLNAFSCSEKSEKKEKVIANHQEIIGPVKIIYPKSIQKDKEFVAKMYSIDTKREIVNAIVDCEDFTKIDSVTFEIQGCFKELLVKNDTVFLAFSPTKPGDFVFEKISVITTDLMGKSIKIHEIDLRYKVTN